MLLYHGTVSAYLNSIETHGLKPVASNAWHIITSDGGRLRDIEKTDAVYLTPLKSLAENYAKAKAKYLSVKPGDKFQIFGNMVATKETIAPWINTEPVLLTVDMPETDETLERFTGDPHASNALRYMGKIPPSDIIKIDRLTAN